MENKTGLERTVIVELTKLELMIINNALNEILNGPSMIDEEEFHPRVGANREEAKDLFKKIKEAANFEGGIV